MTRSSLRATQTCQNYRARREMPSSGARRLLKVCTYSMSCTSAVYTKRSPTPNTQTKHTIETSQRFVWK